MQRRIKYDFDHKLDEGDLSLGIYLLVFILISVSFLAILLVAISISQGEDISILGLSIILICSISVLIVKGARKKLKNAKELYVNKIDDLNKILEVEEDKLKKIFTAKFPFSTIASMYSDAMVAIFKDSENYLTQKYSSAYKAADEVRKFREKTKQSIFLYKQMLYKYEFILKIFPELKQYIDEEEALVTLFENDGLNDLEAKRDRVSDYISKEEWGKLDVNKRNQLALDRYKEKSKSNWVIGIEYEMYVEYILRKNGFETMPFGSIMKLEDLGRDIVATKRNAKGELVAYIIQCKNWASNKEIHENVICQLFGTAMEYNIKNAGLFSKTVPVLYTTVRLSNMATEFSQRLGVTVVIMEKGEYPMIKCNINSSGERIYHLPFDQQYYNTQITKPGEFYAWTVREAVNAGFRRAFKYSAYNKTDNNDYKGLSINL
uniref:restriction endonuclease n=1 Tax=Bacteroides cellulosilyticus TaxID=246787 RepID=UPI003FF04039